MVLLTGVVVATKKMPKATKPNSVTELRKCVNIASGEIRRRVSLSLYSVEYSHDRSDYLAPARLEEAFKLWLTHGGALPFYRVTLHGGISRIIFSREVCSHVSRF